MRNQNLKKIKEIKKIKKHDFFCSDLNHDLIQWFKSNDLNQTTLELMIQKDI